MSNQEKKTERHYVKLIPSLNKRFKTYLKDIDAPSANWAITRLIKAAIIENEATKKATKAKR